MERLLIVCLVSMFLLSGCASLAYRNEAWIIEKDPLISNRWVLRNKYGDIVGYAERDTISPDRIVIKNKYGDRKGVIINEEPFN